MTDRNTAQLLADLKATDDAVKAQGWVAPGLGTPGAPLDLLGSTLNPLSALDAAGLGWFTPLVSFLGDGLAQLQGGNAASLTSGARDFGEAGRDIAAVADAYRESTTAQTSNWSGAAAAQYHEAGAQHAEGIAALGQASTTTGSAIMGAGQVVAQAIAEVTELVTQAVAKIVPIMSQAMARAGETFGQSVVAAIPPCIGIAAEYAMQVASKLAALLASGDNLLQLVHGGMAAVDLVQQELSSISQRSIGGAVPGAVDQLRGGGPANAAGAPSAVDTAPGTTGSPAAPSTPGGVPSPDGPVTPQGTHSWTPPATSSAATLPDASRPLGQLGANGVANGAPNGAISIVRSDSGHHSTRASGGGVPLGAMGGAQPAGEADKEHQRKYELAEDHDDDLPVAPPFITGDDKSA